MAGYWRWRMMRKQVINVARWSAVEIILALFVEVGVVYMIL